MFFRFQDHVVYERVAIFTKEVYSLTGHLPTYEQPGLIQKLRDLASQMLQDLAEGYSHTPDTNESTAIDRCIISMGKIASLVDLCFQLDYLDVITHKKWLMSCEELTKRLYETRKSLK